MINTDDLLFAMFSYFRGDAKRIQHFMKVHSFAKLIGEQEELSEAEQFIVETAAIIHDIGIKPAEEKYGDCNGKLQEIEGPPATRRMLTNLGYEESVIDRVCYLVGHHHTYDDIKGIDYQILVEADFLVNIYEDGLDKTAVQNVYSRIFKTESGIALLKTMYDL